jgi:hypothetical protein
MAKIDTEIIKLLEAEIHTLNEKFDWIIGFLQANFTQHPTQQIQDIQNPQQWQPPVPIDQQPVIDTAPKSNLPAWEREKLLKQEEKPKPKAKISKRLIIFIAVFVILIVGALFMRSLGWSCTIPGM